jgi:hypothetical protein
MRWGYDQPRAVAITGQSRRDLGLVLTKETFDHVADVEIDAETMTPMPRSFKQYLLDDMLSKGLISAQEYRRRLPFAFIGSLESADEDQYARAKRVCEAIRETGNPTALPVLWQDNEAIHQDVLERDLILPDDTDPTVRQAAIQRWTLLAQQAQQKQAPPMPPTAPAGAPVNGGGHGDAPTLPPQTAPLALSNPSLAAAPQMMAQHDATRAAADFEHFAPQ